MIIHLADFSCNRFGSDFDWLNRVKKLNVSASSNTPRSFGAT